MIRDDCQGSFYNGLNSLLLLVPPSLTHTQKFGLPKLLLPQKWIIPSNTRQARKVRGAIVTTWHETESFFLEYLLACKTRMEPKPRVGTLRTGPIGTLSSTNRPGARIPESEIRYCKCTSRQIGRASCRERVSPYV